MKKFLLPFLLLLTFQAWSQQYHPLLDSTAWFRTCTNFGITWHTWITSSGDSTVNSMVYKKYGSDLIREDAAQRKVYRIEPNQPEQVLYDFNLVAGNTFPVYNGGYVTTFNVMQVDSVLTSAGYRDRWILQHPTQPNIQIEVIESVGSLFHPFTLWNMGIQDPVCWIVCSYQQGLPVYNSNNASCPAYLYTANNVTSGNSSACACTGQAAAWTTTSSSYLWTPGPQYGQVANNLCPGGYTVTITDNSNGSTSTYAVAIGTNPPLTSNTTYTNATCSSCVNGTASITPNGGSGTYSYSWQPGGQTTQSVSGLAPGTYTACVNDGEGCSACDTINISFANGIFSPERAGFSLYPNPAANTVQIIAPQEYHIAMISDIAGREKMRITLSSAGIIDVSGLTAGTYFVTFISEREGYYVRRLVVWRQ
jgi:hypothetical protein